MPDGRNRRTVLAAAGSLITSGTAGCVGDGRLLGRYFDRVSGPGAGTAWQFAVIVLESPASLGAYGIAALAIPP